MNDVLLTTETESLVVVEPVEDTLLETIEQGVPGPQGDKGDKGDPGDITPEYVALAVQVQTDKSATDMALQSAQQAAQVASEQATLATQKAVATAADRDAVALLAGQVQTDKSATSMALQSAEQAAQVASDQATLATQKAVATAADRDAVTQTASQVALNKAATDTNLAASQLALQNAQVQAGIATTKATESVSARDQSVAARDLSVAAWAASMAPAETLPAISKLMHSGSVVKVLIYDASKDSDGGAWRKRCQDKSWYTEPINGVWLGQAATATAAWALSGAVTGAYFQNTTDGFFYALGAASPAVTQTYRGNAREFPEQVGIIIETSRLVIYDLTQPTVPMWMVFNTAGAGFALSTFVFSSAFAINGNLYATASGANGGMSFLSFIADASYAINGTSNKYNKVTVANRNASGSSVLSEAGTAPIIASRIANDVTAIVLENAPIDAATGLAVPTIVVSTNGGVSIIKHDGTVTNWLTTKGYIRTAYINKQGGIAATGGETVGWSSFFKNVLPTGATNNTFDYVFDGSSIPTRLGTNPQYGKMETIVETLGARAFASAQQVPVGGVTLMKDNPSAPTTSMIAYINAAFNSGWMVGDIRGAWLSDTVAESLVSSELITNGTNPTSTTGWTKAPNNSTLTINGANQFVANSGVANNVFLGQQIATVAGKSYQVQFTKISTENMAIYVGPTFNSATIAASPFSTGAGTFSLTFTATGSVAWIQIAGGGANATGTFNNISCKLVTADRSAKNSPLSIIGTLTKTAVATGANLVKYSGFTAGANYLQQPYSANLDYGTGDFHYAFWMDSTSAGCKFSRGSGSVAGSFAVANAGAGGALSFQHWNGSAFATIVSATIPAGVGLCVIQRVGASVQVWWNGVLIQSGTSANTMTCAGAEFHVGNLQSGSQGDAGWTALLRTGATSLSADQITKMYADELPLFQPGAQCTIDGTSSSVTALAYDDVADLLHVGTSWGRSSFRGLARVESEATTVGAVTSISGNQGARLLGGATGCRAYQPAMLLRDELRREEVARRALGQRPQFFEFDAIAAQTAFVIPKGYTAKAVYSAGVLQREGTTKAYTRSFDGFSETINFAVAPGAAVWVSIMCIRSA